MLESEKTLTERIMAISQLMNDKYPEISQFIAEMPVTNPDAINPAINRMNLQEYYDSLIEMLRKYKANHILQEIENIKNKQTLDYRETLEKDL